MQAVLIVTRGMHTGRRIRLHVPEFLIGRDASCHLRPNNKGVQPVHCVFVNREQSLFLRDAGSGTRCNGRLLFGGELQLADGDAIEVGSLSFRLVLNGAGLVSPGVPIQAAQGQSAQETVCDSHELAAASLAETATIPNTLPTTPTSPEDSLEVLCPN